MHRLCLSLAVALLLIVPGSLQAGRAIPDDNLAYPVLVQLDAGSTGSGFFLNTAMDAHFVTASHVLFDEVSGNLKGKKATLLSYSKDPKETRKNSIKLDLPSLLAAKKIRKHPTQDVTTVHIGTFEDGRIKPVSGVAAVQGSPGILGVGINNVKRFSDVLTANQIYVFGYPTSIGLKEIPQVDPLRPLLRVGIVAGTNPARKTIILDCPSYPGNSGGPVLEVEEVDPFNRHFQVIGVVSQFVSFAETWVNVTHKYQNLTLSNSGYTVAVPMDAVLELTIP